MHAFDGLRVTHNGFFQKSEGWCVCSWQNLYCLPYTMDGGPSGNTGNISGERVAACLSLLDPPKEDFLRNFQVESQLPAPWRPAETFKNRFGHITGGKLHARLPKRVAFQNH